MTQPWTRSSSRADHPERTYRGNGMWSSARRPRPLGVTDCSCRPAPQRPPPLSIVLEGTMLFFMKAPRSMSSWQRCGRSIGCWRRRTRGLGEPGQKGTAPTKRTCLSGETWGGRTIPETVRRFCTAGLGELITMRPSRWGVSLQNISFVVRGTHCALCRADDRQ